MKSINIEDSKYIIEYQPDKVYDYRVIRKTDGQNVSGSVKSNVMNDLVFWLVENLEKGVQLEGITVDKI